MRILMLIIFVFIITSTAFILADIFDTTYGESMTPILVGIMSYLLVDNFMAKEGD